MAQLSNKHLFITGASSGLGYATALECAKQGARVYGIGRNTSGLAQLQQAAIELDGSIVVAEVDISSAAACKAAIAACVAQFGTLDALINVAGKHSFRPLDTMTENDWEADIAVNLSAPFYFCQAAIPHLLKTAGNIVNVSSVAGMQGQTYSAGYCAAKHGMIGLTRALAIEFTKTTLRVNAVCPGGMDTPQVHSITIPENADFELIMRTAAPRGIMQASEVAAVIAFLASDAASAIHGAVIPVDRGKTVG